MLTLAIAMFSLFAASCAQEPLLPPDADAGLISGYDVYRARCASCHGSDGGGGIGRSLQRIETRLTDAEQIEVISGGRNRMPRFDGLLSESDIEDVVRFTREIF